MNVERQTDCRLLTPESLEQPARDQGADGRAAGAQLVDQRDELALAGLDPAVVIGQDAMHIALEDDSGYLTLSPPKGAWKPGRYKVEIHVGEQVNEMSLMGTMRFTIVAEKR